MRHARSILTAGRWSGCSKRCVGPPVSLSIERQNMSTIFSLRRTAILASSALSITVNYFSTPFSPHKRNGSLPFIIKHIRMLIGDSCVLHHVATISITSFQEPLFAKSFLRRQFLNGIHRILLLTFRDEPIFKTTVNVTFITNSSLK